MAKISLDKLLEMEQWIPAEKLIRHQLEDQQESHWLWTQLGSVLYEQRKYKSALKPLLTSLELVSDCPLTLWHLAGTYDALGKYEKALSIYVWLLQSKQTAKADPCWESEAWTNALKTDCVFRIGLVLEHQKKWQSASEYFHQYIKLRLAGLAGSYSMEDAAHHLAVIMANNKDRPVMDPRQAMSSTMHQTRTLQGNKAHVGLAAVIAG